MGTDFAPPEPLPENGGFTLLEVVVAVAVIAIVFTASFRLFSQSAAMAGAARFYATAPALAQMKLSGVPASGKLEETSGAFGDDFPGYVWQLEMTAVEQRENGTDFGKTFYRIDVTVRHEGAGFIWKAREFRRLPEASS